jgi:hypothetical protein
VYLLKSKKELKELDPDSKDVVHQGMVHHYENRPVNLEDCCLAEFAAFYTFSKNTHFKENKPEGEKIEGPSKLEKDDKPGTVYKLKNGLGFIKRRQRALTIRYCKFSKEIKRYF